MNGGRRKWKIETFCAAIRVNFLGGMLLHLFRGWQSGETRSFLDTFSRRCFETFRIGPVCYFLPSRLVKFFDDSGTQIFIWYDVPLGSLFIMNFFGSSSAAATCFKAASFGEVYFSWESFRNCSKPRTARRITRRMQFHIKVFAKRRKLIKCFVMQGNHRQKNFPIYNFCGSEAFPSLARTLHRTTKFKCKFEVQ